jgi:pilus assembly protein CpaE
MERKAVPHSILIVDDSPTAAPELRALLEREGYQVQTALRAEEALDALRTSRIDLVVTEALLPTTDGFELVRQIRQIPAASSVPIIMLTVRSAPEDYATAFEAGTDEYFLKPMEPPKIVAAIRGLIARNDMGRLDHRGAGRIAGSNGLPSRTERGQIITVFSPKGGVGKTTIAVNLAVAIKQLAPSSRVALIDLSLEEGHVALLLDIVPTSTIVEWAREDLTGATPHMLNQYFVQHRSGVALLAAPLSPEQAETVRPAVVRLTLQLAPQAFDYVVVDTAANFGESSLVALESAQVILLPVTPDVAAMKSAVNTLRVLQAVKIKHEKVRVLQNEIIPRAGLSTEQLESALGKELTVLPHGGPAFVEAANHGIPLVSLDPRPPAAKPIIDLARTLCIPEFDEVPVQQKAGFGLLRGRLEDSFTKLRRA